MKVFGINNRRPYDSNIIENEYEFQNILNVLGWIPMLGTVIGTIRIGNTLIVCIEDDNSDESSHKRYYAVSTLRGVAEIFSFGIFCVVPDVIASIIRKRKLAKNKN